MTTKCSCAHLKSIAKKLKLIFTPPCKLHLILEHHKYLWMQVYMTIERREQLSIIPKAFEKIGCAYLLQCFEKKSSSGTLEMKVNECQVLEDNIGTFLNCFVKSGDTWDCPRSCRLRVLKELYVMFKGIAFDIRRTTYTPEQVGPIRVQVEDFYRKFVNMSVGFDMPYLQMLVNHFPWETFEN